MKKQYTLFILLSIIYTFSFAQDKNPFLRYPAINKAGTQISFSYQGDIWVAATSGGIANRITIHEAYESHPQWSMDDQQISFQSSRYGNTDIFVTTPLGNSPKQITYYSGSDRSAKWTKDGQLLFNSNRFFAEVEREAELYQADTKGGTPFRALDVLGFTPAPSPDGRYIAFVRGSCRTTREAYKGPANRDIWLYDTKTKSYQELTNFEGMDILPDWGSNNTLYYLSAKNGRYNIYAQEIANGKASGAARAVTNFTDEGIRYFDASIGGKLLIFEKGTSLYSIETGNYNSVKKLDIQVSNDFRFDPVEQKKLTKGGQDLALAPNGKYMAFSLRGEIFISPTDKEKKRSVQLSKHAYRDRNPQWLNDTTLIYLSDRNGNNDIFLVRSADANQSSLYQTLKIKEQAILESAEDEFNLILSPDKTKLAFRRGRGQLIVVDINAAGQISNEKVLVDGWAIPNDPSWSPDSKWLAYALYDLDFNSEIYVHKADNSSPPVNVSLHPREDESPVWSADGSKLGFLSIRNNGDSDVWFVWLKKEDWDKTKRDWEEEEPADEKGSKKDKDKKKDTPVTVEIDFEDIHERIVQVTREAGNEHNLAISKDGKTFYYSTNGGGRSGSGGKRAFKQIMWDRTEEKTLIANKGIRQLAWNKDGKALFIRDTGGAFSKLDVGKNKQESIPFEAKMKLDYSQERRQIFNDAWRALDAGFYDPNFHGQDWSALKKKYEDIAVQASTTQDFRALFNEMLGQVNASHMGLYGPDREETQREQTGLLGVEVTPNSQGVQVQRIIKNSPATRTSSLLSIGDIIKSVNGQAITSTTNFYALMSGTTNERTLLEVSDANGVSREVVIRPTNSLRNQLYENWVQQQKDLTAQYSNGRLGYLHIRGMGWGSFERFERELAANGLGKEGIVIDVRFNGGGWTTDMLMAILNVRQHAYTIPRGAAKSLEKEHLSYKNNYPYGERLPLSSWTKPSIAMCNENSYSNAEIFSHAYKHLGHGTLVGQPTFGAVISTGSYSLVDGSRVRMPFRAWYVKATEKNMEFGPAVPDIIIENSPAAKANNKDEQLEKAVDTLLKQIDK